jgi:hypothetical protein
MRVQVLLVGGRRGRDGVSGLLCLGAQLLTKKIADRLIH